MQNRCSLKRVKEDTANLDRAEAIVCELDAVETAIGSTGNIAADCKFSLGYNFNLSHLLNVISDKFSTEQ